MAAPSDLTPDEQAQMDLGITPVVSAVDVAVGEVGAEIALGADKEARSASMSTGWTAQICTELSTSQGSKVCSQFHWRH